MRVKFLSAIIGMSIVLVLSPSVEAQLTTLPASVVQVLTRHRLPAKHLSVFIQDVTQEKPLLVFAADEPRNPASTIKLLTTFVALEVLGPTYTWVTEAYADGPVHNGSLDGNLVIKGQGDPFLVREVLWKFLRELRDRGLAHISGDLVIDNSYFKPEASDPAAFDGQPYRSYNALPDALLVNYQSIRFTFLPDVAERKIRIIPAPKLANLKVINSLRFKQRACRGHLRRIQMIVVTDDAGGTVEFKGDYPASCGEFSLYRAILPTPAKAYGIFQSLWRDMGGTIDGQLRVGEMPDDTRLLHAIESRPLADLIRAMNKFSNNVMTRQLFLTLGAERFGAPGTETKGKAAISTWLQDHHLIFPELVLDNGAGLSRLTRISARSVGRLLLAAYTSPYMPEFVSSLPLAAMDGTMKHRLRHEPMAGRAHIKTGSLDNVSAMAGYVLSHTGRMYVIVTLHNNSGVHHGAGRAIQDTLLRWLFES